MRKASSSSIPPASTALMCRQLAPATFDEAEDASFVRTQPASSDARQNAFQALVACPVGAIGSHDAAGARGAVTDFPLHLEGSVFYCGFNSADLTVLNSYFISIRRATG